jgi:hypothetical protein
VLFEGGFTFASFVADVLAAFMIVGFGAADDASPLTNLRGDRADAGANKA